MKPFETRVVISSRGVLSNHVEYLAKYRNKSQSWRNQSCNALVKFLDYTEAYDGKFRNPREMFDAFSQTLVDGTILEDGSDPTHLWWEPLQPSTANSIINHITKFSDFIYNKTQDESHLLNPDVHATRSEFMISLAAYHHRKNNSFFAHTFDDQAAIEKAKRNKLIKLHHVSKPKDIKATEENVIIDLITNGFWRSKNRNDLTKLNIKNVLITMLISYGGLRVSEPFHIFISDIYDDPVDDSQSFINIQHPALGEAPEYWRKHTGNKDASREMYLREKYGLRPRTDQLNSSHVGWKSSHKTSINVYMFPSKAARWFKVLVDIYIKEQRKSSPTRPHPYLFSDENGNPATIKQYTEARKKALRKLGYDHSKYAGNNPHGGRHFYGSTLNTGGVSAVHIKEAMHHSSITSQHTYVEASVKKEMRAQMLKLESEGTEPTSVQTSPDIQDFCNDIKSLSFE